MKITRRQLRKIIKESLLLEAEMLPIIVNEYEDVEDYNILANYAHRNDMQGALQDPTLQHYIKNNEVAWLVDDSYGWLKHVGKENEQPAPEGWDLDKIYDFVKRFQDTAWKEYQKPIFKVRDDLNDFLEVLMAQSNNDVELKILHKNLNDKTILFYHDIITTARKTLPLLIKNNIRNTRSFKNWLNKTKGILQEKYSSNLYSVGINAAEHLKLVPPKYKSDAPEVDGRIILRDNYPINICSHSCSD